MQQWLGCADPGRIHTEGRMARASLEDSRAAVAGLLATRPRQVIFTSGGTEAVNAATYGVLADRPGGVALAGTEHSAVRDASARWATSVSVIGVDSSGAIDLDHLSSVLAGGGISLLHCQSANHEVGTLQPVSEAVEVAHRLGVMVHVDACTSAGRVPVGFDALGADLMSVSSHKLGGPAGIGALLVRRGLRVRPLLVGGAQERARRGGLENVAGAAGFGAACAELVGSLHSEMVRSRAQVGRLRDSVLSVEGVVEYGCPSRRVPHILCVGVDGVEAEPVLIGLDRAGVAVHSGSSCSSEELEPSPVLAAMGVDGERSLRLSVGWSTTDAEIDLAAGSFPAVVNGLRRLRA